jgi:hypothetical protein
MNKKTFQAPVFALSLSLSLLASLSGASAQGTADSAYLERRNDHGIVVYCSGKDLLDPDAEQFFKVGTDEIFGEVENTPEADLHEQKGRDGMSYLQGEEQSLADLAEANGVSVAEVCGQYKAQITLGRMIAKNKPGK